MSMQAKRNFRFFVCLAHRFLSVSFKYKTKELCWQLSQKRINLNSADNYRWSCQINIWNFSLLFVHSLSSGFAVCSCPDGWLTHGETCYHFSHDRETFPGAKVNWILVRYTTFEFCLQTAFMYITYSNLNGLRTISS